MYSIKRKIIPVFPGRKKKLTSGLTKLKARFFVTCVYSVASILTSVHTTHSSFLHTNGRKLNIRVPVQVKFMGGIFSFLHSNILHYLKNKHVLHSNTHWYIMSLGIVIITSSFGSYFILPWRKGRPRDTLSFYLLNKPFCQVIYTRLAANFTTNNNLLVLFIHNSFSVQITAKFCNIIRTHIYNWIIFL